MKLMNKSLLAFAVASIASPSFAAWTTSPGANKAVIVQGVTSSKISAAATANAVYTLAAPTEGLTANDTITIELTGGAKFNGTTAVRLTPSAGDLGAGAATAAAPLTGGGAGSTSATWRALDAAVVAGTTLTLNSASTIFDVSGVTAGTPVQFVLTLKTSTGIVIGTAAHSTATEPAAYADGAFKGANLFTITTNTPSSDVLKVANQYKTFDAAGTNKTTSLASHTLTLNATATSIPSQTVTAKKVLVTLAGDFNGITSVDAAVAGELKGDDGTGAGAGTADKFTINAAKTNAYAVSNASQGFGDALDSNLNFVLDGTTIQPARSFTAKFELLADTLFTPYVIQAPVNFVTLTRDGTFFTTNSTGPLNNIKITDQSGTLPPAGGAITVMAYNADGVAIAPGAAAIPTSVKNNGTTTLTGSALGAKFPDAVRYDVTVESNDANITNIKKDTTGIDAAHYRSGTGGGL